MTLNKLLVPTLGKMSNFHCCQNFCLPQGFLAYQFTIMWTIRKSHFYLCVCSLHSLNTGSHCPGLELNPPACPTNAGMVKGWCLIVTHVP